MKRAIFLLAAAVAVAALPARADTAAWFDSGLPDLASWPADGSDLVVEGQGTWTGTAGATLVPGTGALAVNAPAETPVAFAPLEGGDLAAADAVFYETVEIPSLAAVTGLDAPRADAKFALAAAVVDGTPRYFGWAKDPDGATNAWLALDGAAPREARPLRVRIRAKNGTGSLLANYSVDGTELSAGGETWLPVVSAGTTLSGVGMSGRGLEVSALSGATGDGLAALSMPAMPTNVAVASVTTNGVAVEPDGGVWRVEAGATVVVTFAAADGCVLTGAPASAALAVASDTTFPAASVPTAVALASMLEINEVMASNPSPDKGGLTTEQGLAELDWIELRNSASVDIDVSGWYVSDDAAKPKKKAIQGTCVVPAGGYKIVWCTKEYAKSADGWNETEGRVEVNLSAGGDLVQLADPDGNVVDAIDFNGKQQIKGYSYGPGTVSHGPHAGEGPYVYMKTATPGDANVAEGWSEPTPEVAFSVPHGYYATNFVVELSCAADPTNIWYTLDGSSPAPGSAASRLYDTNAPIAVSGTTVLRAAVPDAGSVLQLDAARTYIFLADVLAQDRSTAAPAVEPYFPDNGAVNGQAMRYGMLQSVVADAESNERLLRGFTNSIATISVVVDPQNLFNASTGIYVNPRGEGAEWERAIMLEQIDPLAADGGGFSQPAGIRIRGGNSRNTSKPKHSLRFFFRSSYGKSSLDFPLFGDEGVDEFDKVDLRTSQNLSWANENSTLDTFVTEVFSRDSQRDLGQPYTRSRYYNLFLNGQYWGLYQTQERADEHWGESYLGGDSLKFDLIKTASSYVNNKLGYSIECNEGTWDAWSNLWEIATNEGFADVHSNNYRRVLGQNPDGTRNPAYPVLVNQESLMVYMLVSHFVVDKDGPTSPFSSIDVGHPNNFYAIRNRDDDGAVKGFVFLRHDAELSMGIDGNYTAATRNPTFWGTDDPAAPTVGSPDPSGLGKAKFRTIPYFTPSELHYLLMQNPDYARAYADLFDKHVLREGGALTVEKNTERYLSRMAEIDDAIVCEQARWATGGQSRSTWLSACSRSVQFITNRVSNMKSQYVAAGWYPSVETPRASTAASGGTVYTNNAVVADGENVWFDPVPAGGTVWYTLDGSDPLTNGVLSSTALEYDPATGFALPVEGATVRARAIAGGTWSALEEVKLASQPPETVPLQDALRVAALYTSTTDGGDAGEFIVLTNLSAEASVVLSGGRLVAWNAAKKSEADPSLAISAFDGLAIGPGGSLTLDQATYFGAKGKLTNSQVGLRVYDATNGLVQDVYVDADNWWNGACDGTGEWFLAKDFSNVATNRVQWKPTATSLTNDVRVAAIYSSTAGDGDTGEFVALTNLNASARDLSDVRIVAWNAKKQSEANPSLVIVLDGTSVPAGGSVTLDKETFFGAGKLTNGRVGLRVYDPAGTLVQDCYVDADWWEGACDGTGRWFVAADFGSEAKTDVQWTPSPAAPAIPLPEDATAKDAVLAAIGDNAAIGDWLVDIGATAAGGYTAITNFTGTKADIELCYFLDILPDSNPEIELAIPSISFDGDGNPVVEGELLNHGEEVETTIRGTALLYYADALEDLATTTNRIRLDPPAFPAEATNDMSGATVPGARFYRLRIER